MHEISFKQSFIHLMNEFDVRNRLIRFHMKNSQHTRSFQWWGTWFVRERDGQLHLQEKDPCWRWTPKNVEDLLRKKCRSLPKDRACTAMFTVCLLYENHLVHYVSFLYFTSTRSLLSFDPGVQVYPHGQNTIVPLIQKLFEKQKRIDSHIVEGACSSFQFKKKKHGVQFNGQVDRSLPADAFCQSWTLFFFMRVLYLPEATINNISSFVGHWCKIPPCEREHFLTSFFIHPTLVYFPSILEKWRSHGSKREIIETMFLPLEQCFFAKHKK